MAQAMITMRNRAVAAASSRITDFFVNGDAAPADPAPASETRVTQHANPVLGDSNCTSTGPKKPRKRGLRPKSASTGGKGSASTGGKGSASIGAKVAGQEAKSKSSSASTTTNSKKQHGKVEEPQKPITDFFEVRRSDRRGKTSREVKKAKEMEIVEKIKAGCEDGLQVQDIEGKGRGVVASRDFLKDDFVVEYAGELVSITTARQREDLYERDERVGCYMYYFTHGNKHFCMDATAESGKLGRLVNHSRRGNCYTKVFPIGATPHLALLACQHIEKGQELTYDYGDRSQKAIESHPWLKL